MSESLQKPFARRHHSLWVEVLRQPKVWRRAILLGLPIGLLQAAINQGDFWWNHAVDASVLVKTILSPLVTFFVVLISSGAAHLEKNKESLAVAADAPEKFDIPIAVEPQPQMHFPNPRNYDRIEI
jgi:hypothetical protein